MLTRRRDDVASQNGVKNGVPKNPQTIEEWFEFSEALQAEKRPPGTGVSPTPDVDLSILRGVGTTNAAQPQASVDPDTRFERYGGYGGAKPGSSRTSVWQGGE